MGRELLTRRMTLSVSVIALAGSLSEENTRENTDDGGDSTDTDNPNESDGSHLDHGTDQPEVADTDTDPYPDALSSVFREMLEAENPDSHAQSSDVIQYDAESRTVAVIVTTAEGDTIPVDGVDRAGDPISTPDGTVRGAWIATDRLESLAAHENVTDVSVDPIPENG